MNKLDFSSSIFHRLRIAAVLLVCPLVLAAQTSYHIDASGVSFTPDEVTVQAGDTVIWTNSSGTHNVNGTTDTYPDNPESFGNEIGAGWVYSFVFTVAGTYDYQCDVHVGSGMVGKVIVEEATAVPIVKTENAFSLYPNPAEDYIVISLEQELTFPGRAVILDVTGRRVHSALLKASVKSIVLPVDHLKEGLYMMKIEDGATGQVHSFIKR